MNGYEYMATILKALGHPVRLQILAVLQQGEACVCHLEAVLGYRQAYISQHLMRLREAGLVVDRREGMYVLYALANDAIAGMLDVVQETAAALAQAKGRQLRLPLPLQGAVPGCTCLQCQPKGADTWVAQGS